MNTHAINCSEVQYPVGTNMKSASKYADEVIKFIKNNINLKEQINIFCSGSSGAILSSLVYAGIKDIAVNVRIYHIKKTGEDSHSNNNFYAYEDSTNIILDDFSASGATIERIYNAFKEYNYNGEQIHYLILSGIGTSSKMYIEEVMKPLNIVTSESSLETYKNHKYEKETDITL